LTLTSAICSEPSTPFTITGYHCVFQEYPLGQEVDILQDDPALEEDLGELSAEL
jgi:hypothetical protein